jgi:hypothetical protein
MKQTTFILIAIFIASCTPKKSDNPTRVDIYCDSCYVKVNNEYIKDDTRVVETPFKGIVNGFKSVEFYRFETNSCVKVMDFINYSNDTPTFYYIEVNDTLFFDHNAYGFCY